MAAHLPLLAAATSSRDGAARLADQATHPLAAQTLGAKASSALLQRFSCLPLAGLQVESGAVPRRRVARLHVRYICTAAIIPRDNSFRVMSIPWQTTAGLLSSKLRLSFCRERGRPPHSIPPRLDSSGWMGVARRPGARRRHDPRHSASCRGSTDVCCQAAGLAAVGTELMHARRRAPSPATTRPHRQLGSRGRCRQSTCWTGVRMCLGHGESCGLTAFFGQFKQINGDPLAALPQRCCTLSAMHSWASSLAADSCAS